MRFRIRHESLYRYDVPVALGPHLLRLTPRPECVEVRAHRLVVEPEPTAWQREIDALGNVVTRVCFSGTTQRLRIDSELEVDTIAPPPLGALAEPLPAALAVAHGAAGPPHPSVARFADSLAADVGREPVAFLDRLSQTLFTRFERHIRPTGDARPAHETIALGSGACRDLTTVFLESCRTFGLGARFVSGYQAHAETPDGQRHLHAWAEVLLPGVGWRGWDATHGMRTGEGHIALCAAATQAGAMPVEGSFSFVGATVNSTLDHSVHIATGENV